MLAVRFRNQVHVRRCRHRRSGGHDRARRSSGPRARTASPRPRSAASTRARARQSTLAASGSRSATAGRSSADAISGDRARPTARWLNRRAPGLARRRRHLDLPDDPGRPWSSTARRSRPAATRCSSISSRTTGRSSCPPGSRRSFNPGNRKQLWGAFGYTPDKDVVRAPMTLTTLPYSVDQLTWAFLDMTDAGGRMALMWDRQMAAVPFSVAPE